MQTNIDKLLQKPLVVINLGLKKFAESLEEQKVEVIQVDWVPPAGGDKEMMDLLEQIL
jgi:DNA-binding TFAR19-related protein (PDSD5 family)